MLECKDEKEDFFNLSVVNQDEDDKEFDVKSQKEWLEMQISECEMLQSMFPRSDELSLDYGILVDVQDYLSGKSLVKPPQLNYTVHLNICDSKLDVIIFLPSEYPHVKPEVYVRSDQLNRNQQNSLNESLSNYISNLEKDEIIIGSIIFWLQENAETYFLVSKNEVKDSVSLNVKKEENIFNRLWIYSHHIYSKVKRRIILDLADEYVLTGFCLPGKPGIICFEGYENNCQESWKKVFIIIRVKVFFFRVAKSMTIQV